MKSIILAIVVAVAGISSFIMLASVQVQAENVREGGGGGGRR
jgi:hypothetical protein